MFHSSVAFQKYVQALLIVPLSVQECTVFSEGPSTPLKQHWRSNQSTLFDGPYISNLISIKIVLVCSRLSPGKQNKGYCWTWCLEGENVEFLL